MVEQAQKAGGDVDHRMAVAPARLDEHHLVLAVGRQTVGEHAACGARADDHIVGNDLFKGLAHGVTVPP